jgi:hypothetical protein
MHKWVFSMKPECNFLPLSLLVLLLTGCGGGSSSPSAPSNLLSGDYTAFSNPVVVTITGYSGDAMEPFVSRDGMYLFFNDAGGPTNKDLFYATFGNDTTYLFQGALTTINTAAVDGVPTMDNANTFYYVSTANYNPPVMYDTLYTGTWNGSTITGSVPVTGLAIATPGFINFDVEITPDGSTLYFNDGDFTGRNSFPDAANIVTAVDAGSGFSRDPNSAAIMANVNTANLEYAPAISADNLELFFTRLDLGTMKARIYRATRANTSAPFGVPQLVSAIDGFVEGPTFSPDEKSLYYHRLNTGTGKFQIYRVTRP